MIGNADCTAPITCTNSIQQMETSGTTCTIDCACQFCLRKRTVGRRYVTVFVGGGTSSRDYKREEERRAKEVVRSASREASLEEVRRRSREVVRFGMHSTPAGYHQHGVVTRFPRSNLPSKQSFYQGEF